MLKIIVSLAIIGVAVVSVFLVIRGRNDNVRPSKNIVSSLCSKERYQGTLERCQANNKVYYRTHPGKTVMDAPDGLYDEQGNLIAYCGGFLPPGIVPDDCTQYPITKSNCRDVTSWCR